MLASFSLLVIELLGRTVAVQPERQIVEPIVAGLTAGLIAPGVQRASGSSVRPDPRARQLPGAGWRCTTVPLAVLVARALAALGALVARSAASETISVAAGTRSLSRVLVARRVRAPSIGEALQAMVEDRRTDLTLEQIEHAAGELEWGG